MEFRRDINGLRAVAVALVVLFHFGVPGLQGGFIGVDVFFVISGYLMTGIIFSRMAKGRFSILEFYLDRARRIIPALAVVCFFAILVGWALLLPEQYVELSKQVLGSLTFISNFMYSQDSGYFVQSEHEKWLLHTWSLSVEWQFYLIYPLAIVTLRKFVSLKNIRWFIVIAAVLSFAISVYASGRWPTHAFYLLPTRAWEMMAGALVYLFPVRGGYGKKVIWELVGFVLIICSALFLSSSVAWPGWLAVLPVIGTTLIMLQARQDSFLTGNPISESIGKFSYSIYLWHWPVVVWITYFGLERQFFWIMTGIAASIMLGYFSYSYIENMARKHRSPTPQQPSRILTKIGIPSSVAAICSAVIILSSGFPQRLSNEFYAVMNKLDLPRTSNGWCFYDVNGNENLPIGGEGLECVRGDKNSNLKGLLFGDSFAGHYGPFWDRLGKEISAKINSVTTNWCYPSTNEVIYGNIKSRSYEQCLINRDYFIDNVSKYDFVVLSGSWKNIYQAGQMQGVYDAVSYAASQTKLVIIMATPTYFDVNVRDYYARSIIFDVVFDIDSYSKEGDSDALKANSDLENFVRQYSNVFFITRGAMFNNDGVPSEVTEENIPYSYDQHGHISIYGSNMAAMSFIQNKRFSELAEKISEVRQRDNKSLVSLHALKPSVSNTKPSDIW